VQISHIVINNCNHWHLATPCKFMRKGIYLIILILNNISYAEKNTINFF
jgi:hypothetical protein